MAHKKCKAVGDISSPESSMDDEAGAWGSDEAGDNLAKPLLRDQWKNRIDFLIACVGFSVGLGNVWRFPYLCYKNGGGAFLIPYLISVFCVGIPLFLLEVTLGQLMSRGVIAAWDICPLFRGIGCASTLINFLVNCYYTVILCWGLHYLFASFTSVLPWTSCNNWWNTENCHLGRHTGNGSSVLASDPATEYWENRVLGLSEGIDHVGSIQWELALCLLLAWTIVFMCICKGIKTSGKVMYITATSPYVFMIILLIRTALLEGASVGLQYYLTPNWSKLGDMMVWSDAGTQIFFSYALSLGALTALGSYNSFDHNSVRDCALFSLINTFTSLLAGCVVFATLGNMAVTSNVSIELVAESGPGLAFVIYPKALGTMPGSPFWSICFFLMILFLGIDSMFGGVEGFVTALADFVPKIHTNTLLRCAVVGSVCVLSFLIGLTMVTNGGMYVFQLFDYYSGSRIVLLVGLLESLVIGYVFGVDRFTRLMKRMYGFSLGWAPRLFWCVITPLFTLILFILSVIVYEELTYRRAGGVIEYRFPDWSVKLGWMMASSSVFLIPITMAVQIAITPGSLKERIQTLLKPRYPEHLLQRLGRSKPTADGTREALAPPSDNSSPNTPRPDGSDPSESICYVDPPPYDVAIKPNPRIPPTD